MVRLLAAQAVPDLRQLKDEILTFSLEEFVSHRILDRTPWLFEGIPGFLTHYRLNSSGLSADVIPQLASWDAVLDKIKAQRRRENTARAAIRPVCGWEHPFRIADIDHGAVN